MKTFHTECLRPRSAGAVVAAMMLVSLMGVPIAAGHGLHIQHEGQATGIPVPGAHAHDGHATGIPAPGAHAHEGKQLEIIMRDGVYHVMNGRDHRYGFTLNAGEETTIILRNQDGVAHEFITPLFTRTEVQFSGDAVGLFGKEAAGFRLDSGKTLTLRFKAPFSEPFRTMFDVVWCNLHKKADGEARDGELLLVATNDIS